MTATDLLIFWSTFCVDFLSSNSMTRSWLPIICLETPQCTNQMSLWFVVVPIRAEKKRQVVLSLVLIDGAIWSKILIIQWNCKLGVFKRCSYYPFFTKVVKPCWFSSANLDKHIFFHWWLLPMICSLTLAHFKPSINNYTHKIQQ